MTHSATTQTDMSWNKPGSLGFSISQRHMGASMTGRNSLIQERTGGLRAAFERHGEFAGKALARMAVRSFPGIPYGRDSSDMEFVHMTDRRGRPHTHGAMRLGMREPAIMRYHGRTTLTPGRAGEEKSASALSPDIGANPKQMDAGLAYMAHTQQIQRVHTVPGAIHGESSLGDSAISRTGHDESSALPGSQQFPPTSMVEAPSANHHSGKQEHGRTPSETVLSAVQPEPARIPGVLTGVRAVPDAADSVKRRLSSGITTGQHQPLPAVHGISGISRISRSSGIMARQTGSLDTARFGGRIGFHGGTDIGTHNGTEAEESGLLARSSYGEPHQQATQTHGEARDEPVFTVFGPDPKRGARAEQAGPSPRVADGHAQAYVARVGAQHPHSSFSASPSAQREVVAIRSPFQIAPAALGDAFHSPHRALSRSVSSQVDAGYSPDHSMVSAHHSLHSESVPVQPSRNDNRDDNASDISRRASESVDGPGNQGTVEHTHSKPNSIILPAVLPAAPFTAVLRQAAAQRLPHKARTSFPLQSREARLGVLAPRLAMSGGHALAGMGRDPTVHRATPAVGGEGGGYYFPASASGLARETISVRDAAPQPYLNRLSGLAESPSLPKGIPGGEAVMASLMVPPSPHSGAAGELRQHDVAIRRAAIAGPALASGPGSTAIPVVHAAAAVDGALQPAATSSSPDYRDYRNEMQRKPHFTSAESPKSSPASPMFAMQATARSNGSDGMAVLRHAGFDVGAPADPSRGASGRMDAAVRPLVPAHGIQQVRQLQRMVAAIGEGGSAPGRIMRLTGEAAGASTHPLPLARQEAPEDQYGVVPAPHRGAGGIHGVPGNEVMAAESSVGKPDADEMAEQAWRLISERLVIEQERRGLAQWHR